MSNSTDQNSKVNSVLEDAIHAILSDRPIAYHASLARALGSVTAGVLLSQLLYWQPRSRDTEGWIWKTQEQIYEETALTRREQETARTTLRKARVIEEKRAGVPAKLYFRVDMKRLIKLLSEFQQRTGSLPGGDTPDPNAASTASEEEDATGAVQNGGKRQTRMAESAKQEWRDPADKNGGNRPTISETTPETTFSETTPRIEADAHEDKPAGETDVPRPHTLPEAKGIPPLVEKVPQGGGEKTSPAPQAHKPPREAPARTPHHPSPRSSAQFEPLAATLRAYQPATAAVPASGQRRQQQAARTLTAQEREVIAAYLTDLASAFGDRATPKVTLSRALHLLEENTITLEAFLMLLGEAAAQTRESLRHGEKPIKRPMAYFFTCLEELLGCGTGAGAALIPPQTPQDGPGQLLQAQMVPKPGWTRSPRSRVT